MSNVVSIKKEKAKRRPVEPFFTVARLEMTMAESIAAMRNGTFKGLAVTGNLKCNVLTLVVG